MFKISRLTDYGVVILGHLLAHGSSGLPTSANDIAKDSGLPRPTVSKLLKLMAKEKIIRAKRGYLGGYELNQDLRELSLLRFIEAFEGPWAFISCVPGSEMNCRINGKCPQRDGWHMVHKKIAHLLEEISLHDLINSKKSKTISFGGVL